MTNLRLNSAFSEEIRNGCYIALETIVFDPFYLDDISVSMTDLKSKEVRRFIENLFVIYYTRSGYTVLNA